ncbi:high affinity cAMP phosphodiesterase like protein [Zymoseptoria brevis]|uniref:Phosphodiesterase n=1 Tax=Zymoseptoria brevis TaxID=1047168 RepID=A0A0F4G7C7_9PEZI|nr:high affinity cAMP phosphodiesterase like protein [Zymoseptoria brevis]
MEETDDWQCSAIYFCAGSDYDISDLYHASSPPAVASQDRVQRPALADVYSNICRLLDVDQGNFERVFVSSRPDECLTQLADFASTRPTVVLVEFANAHASEQDDRALPFLRHLTADTAAGRYQQRVLPFVLVSLSPTQQPDQASDPCFESGYLEAGAIDTMRSPLCSEAVDRLAGHVKDSTRPPARSLGASMARKLVASISNSAPPEIASHRPDELLSAQRKSAVEEAVSVWSFPAHDLDMDELAYGALVMLEHVLRNPALDQYCLPRPKLMTFILAARRQYKHEREVHYHNWRHAVDVTQSVYCFLCDIQLCPPTSDPQRRKKESNALERLLTPVDALILLVSAIGHDVGHPGVNNAFLVASNHQLAHLYNDKSVLENYHCAAYSQLLRQHWPALGRIPHFRSTMISTILATDMQRHFEYMGYLSDLKQKLEKSDTVVADWSDKDKEHARELAMALLIKAADISNVARPFEISARWAKILMNEFARQGELETELQIPTCLFGGPPNREDLLAAAQSQKGFMSLFGFPLFCGISEVLPNTSCTLPELEKNNSVWEGKIAEEKARREAVSDGRRASRTYGSVPAAAVEEARLRKRESEPQAVPIAAPQVPTSPTRRQATIDHQGQPVRHPAADRRQHMTLGYSIAEEKRASTPALWPSALQLSPTGGSSRRSSKDVALTHMQELNAYAQQNISVAAAGSRRGSADAGWQIHQNHPGSRRGSKDDSLTTILVTSQTGPGSRGSTGSSARGSKTAAATAKRHSLTQRQSSSTSRAPSISATTTSATTTTDQQSLSTHPSSPSPTEDGSMQPTALHQDIVAAVSPPAGVCTGPEDRSHDTNDPPSAPAAVPHTPPPELIEASKSDSPCTISRIVSGDSATSPLDDANTEPRLRQSRSRSRLRGLKFWKRRKDVDSTSGESTP